MPWEPREALGATPVLEGDEVVISRWRRRWRRVRRRIQAVFFAGVIAIPTLGYALRSEDYGLQVAVFAVLVGAFTVLHPWAGTRMWMQAAEVYDEGIVATGVSRFVAPRRFVRWAEVAEVRVEPWRDYGDRVVLPLRGGGALQTVPGELDGAAVDKVRELWESARSAQATGGADVANP